MRSNTRWSSHYGPSRLPGPIARLTNYPETISFTPTICRRLSAFPELARYSHKETSGWLLGYISHTLVYYPWSR